MTKRKIAIVGAGLSGLQAAAKLYDYGHDITVFEANDTIGGHIQTLRVPFASGNTQHEAIIDMGVFMFDPIQMHPYLSTLIKQKNLSLTEIPLDFTVENKTTNNQFSFTTAGFNNTKFRNIQIFLHALKNNPTHSLQYSEIAWEFIRFNRLLKSLSTDPQYQSLSIRDFMKQYHFSDALIENWIFPQMLCWWGSTHDTLLNNSIQVLADSFYKVSQEPQYTLTNGLDQLITLLSESIKDHIKPASPVQSITQTNHHLFIQDTQFDAAILATPPIVASKLVPNQPVLKNYQTTTTTVYCHTDTAWLPKKERWATINFIQDERGHFCTFWVGKLHPLDPKLFLSWGDKLNTQPAPNNIIKTTQFLRTLPTLDYVQSAHAIHAIQGLNKIWYCGAHVHALPNTAAPSLWADNALKSGLAAAESVHQWSLS